MLSTIISILKYVAFYVIVRIFIRITLMFVLIKKHYKEKHFCNHCKLGYIDRFEELNYKFCTQCGRPLDYHEYDERSESYKGDNKNDN